MRIGFFSDVHGNWEALTACLEDFRKEGLQKLFFLGDAVGYGADPNAVVNKVYEISEGTVLGNHDAAAIGRLSPEYFNHYARASFEATMAALTPQCLAILKKFAVSMQWQNFLLVHALPKDPESWGYILSLEDAAENFRHFDHQVCLIGHSHRPVIIAQHDDEYPELVHAEAVRLDSAQRYIVNVGSIGQPRDGNPAACYLIYDTDEESLRFQRVPYDVEAAQLKMKKARIPEYLIERIAVGR